MLLRTSILLSMNDCFASPIPFAFEIEHVCRHKPPGTIALEGVVQRDCLELARFGWLTPDAGLMIDLACLLARSLETNIQRRKRQLEELESNLKDRSPRHRMSSHDLWKEVSCLFFAVCFLMVGSSPIVVPCSFMRRQGLR